MADQTNKKTSEAEGKNIYGFQSIDNISYRIDTEYIYNASFNSYLLSPINTLKATTFIGIPKITVKDKEGEINEDLSNTYRYNAIEVNNIYACAVKAWYADIFGGCGVFSPSVEKNGNNYEITEIRYLPWFSFSQPPNGVSKKYNPVMPGVVWNDVTKQVEAHQCQYLSYGSTNKINNFFIVKDPAKPEPAGESEVVPIIPLLASLNLADKAENMRVNRVGSPNVFVRINEDFINDTMQQYLAAFVSKWGQSTGFLIPGNCELIDPHLMESGAAIERLEYIKKLIAAFFYPIDAYIKEGTLIGGSDAGATQVLLNSISYKLSYIEAAFEHLYNQNLKDNGYKGYTIEIRFPRPNIDRTESIIKQIDQAVKGKAISANEIRHNLPDLNLKELDENELSELSSFYATAQTFGNTTEINNAAPTFGNREVNNRVKETEEQLSKLVDEYEKDVTKIIEKDKNWKEYQKMYKELQEEKEE